MSQKSDKEKLQVETTEQEEHREKKKHKKHKHKSERKDEEHKDESSSKKKQKTEDLKKDLAESPKVEKNTEVKTPAKDSDKAKDHQNDTKETAEPEVHSVNNWEGVDLGDQNRKLKFLKLMGAFKGKDDKAAPAIKQRKTTIESDKLNKDLEKQFAEGLNNKFHRQVGLGFGGSTTPAASTSTKEPAKPASYVTFDD